MIGTATITERRNTRRSIPPGPPPSGRELYRTLLKFKADISVAEGTRYTAEVRTGRVQKYTPRKGANPEFLVGKPWGVELRSQAAR